MSAALFALLAGFQFGDDLPGDKSGVDVEVQHLEVVCNLLTEHDRLRRVEIVVQSPENFND